MKDKLVNPEYFAERLDVSVRTLKRLIKDDKNNIPKPRVFSSHCLRWKKSVIDEYIEGK